MGSIGRVLEIWRYPISSVGGERIARAVGRDGVMGDRQYGLIDASTGEPAAPEREARWRKALHLKAVSADDGGLPTLTFPDGRSSSLDDGGLNETLTSYFGFATAMAAYEHTEQRLGFPLTQYRHRHFSLHLLTTSSLERLATLCRTDAMDCRRFRPTVLIEVEKGSGFVENNWIGRYLRLGGVLRVEEDTTRCGVTFVSQPGLDEDPEILRNILRNNKRHLGIYCSSEASGTTESGDEVFVDA